LNKTLLVGLREFRQRIRSRGFWLGLLGLPMTFLIIWAVTTISNAEIRSAPPSPMSPMSPMPARPRNTIIVTVGYVDQADLIQGRPADAAVGRLTTRFSAFPDTASAERSLRRGTLIAYYVIAPDYRTTGAVERVSHQLPAIAAPLDAEQFDQVLLANLLPHLDDGERTRLRRPFNGGSPTFVDVSASQMATGEPGDLNFLPFLVTVLIMTPLFTSGSYLLQSLLQEKSSRVMEVLLLSLRPTQLLTGKLLGLSLLTLVQYLIWAVFGWLVFAAGRTDFTTTLATSNLSTADLGLFLLYAFGGYLLYATVMAGIGALAPNLENSRAWVFIVSLPILIPFYLWTVIVAAPDDRLATTLSLVPFSAPVAMLLRIGVTTVPLWQHVFSLTLLALTGLGAVWLMARLFRAQTLLSGESLSLRRAWAALTT